MIVTTTPPATTTPIKPTPPTTPPTGSTPPTTPPTGPTPPPAGPDLPALQKLFTDVAAQLTTSDETITKMVTDRSTVGAGWGQHLASIAGRLQGARDTFMLARPAEAELRAKLGVDVLRLAEAAGSLGMMARQRSTLSEGWSAFLDTAIADATAAAALLAPPKADPAPVDPPK